MPQEYKIVDILVCLENIFIYVYKYIYIYSVFFSSVYLFKFNTHSFLLKQVWIETIFGKATESEDIIISEIRSISRPNNQIYRTYEIEVAEKTLAISRSRLPQRLSATLVNAFTWMSSRISESRNCVKQRHKAAKPPSSSMKELRQNLFAKKDYLR